MDRESPAHLERLRSQPEMKAALLSFRNGTGETIRFERAARHTLYWPPIDALVERLGTTEPIVRLQEACVVYNRPCWLIAASLGEKERTPLAIAVAAADGAPVDQLIRLLQSVNYDYWNGSYFFK